MNLRLVGFLVTAIAVVVLLGSLVAGLGRGSAAEPVLSLPSLPPLDGNRIRVEVLNGAGISGLARDLTERLRAEGFDVVYYGNARSPRDSTTILDRSGNAAALAALSRELGIDRIEAAIDTTLYLEASVILGPDWPGRQGIGNRE